jgi:DedD protein
VKTPEPKTAPAAESKPTPKPSDKAEPAAVQKPTSTEPKPAPDDAARASALLNGAEGVTATPPNSISAQGRFIVQVGAFADASKAREVRAQLEKAGLKTYTHVAETPQGKRIRVRVGPFANRAEADKAAQKIKTLDLPAAILTL